MQNLFEIVKVERPPLSIVLHRQLRCSLHI